MPEFNILFLRIFLILICFYSAEFTFYDRNHPFLSSCLIWHDFEYPFLVESVHSSMSALCQKRTHPYFVIKKHHEKMEQLKADINPSNDQSLEG